MMGFRVHLVREGYGSVALTYQNEVPSLTQEDVEKWLPMGREIAIELIREELRFLTQTIHSFIITEESRIMWTPHVTKTTYVSLLSVALESSSREVGCNPL
jgi:hypothetical protein